MGTYFITARLKRHAGGAGMYFSGTPTAVNSAQVWSVSRTGPPSPAPAPTPAPPAPAPDSPLNAGHIQAAVALPTSASGIWITTKGAIADSTTDNVVAILDALSAAALTTHKTVVVPDGDFAYGAAFTASSVAIVGAGPTSILRALDRTNRAIYVKGASAGVQSVQLLTNSASAVGSAYAQAGIVIDGATNFLAYNNYIQQTPYVGIACRGSAASGVISQNTLSGCFAPSIQLTQRTRSVLVKLNHVDAPANDGIQIISYQTDNAPVSAVEASYNWIQNNTGGRGMALVGGRDVSIHNNLVQSNPVGNGIYIAQETGTPTYGVNSASIGYCTIENCGNITAGAAGIEVAAAGNLSAVPIDAQSAFNAAVAGSTLDWTGRSYNGTLTVNKAMTILGLQITSNSGANAVAVTASNVTLDGLTITGPQGTVFTIGERGIYATGSAGGRLNNLVVRNCTITKFGNAGIETDFTSASTITNNIIQDTVYMGVIQCSPVGANVSGNTIQRIGVFGSSANSNNAYGITFSSNNPATNPQPNSCSATSNLVEDVTTWHGIDTHAGIKITLNNNIVRRCYRAMFVTGDGAGRRNSSCSVLNNYIDVPATVNDRWSIQWVNGDNGICTGNNSINWPSGSAVLVVNCSAMSITNNTANPNLSAPAGVGAVISTATTAANYNITCTRCDINQNDTRYGIRYYGPQTNVLFDSNRIATTGGTSYVGGTTAGVSVIPYASGNAGYPYTTPGNTESPDGTTIPSDPSIIDSLGHVWTVTAGVVYRDSVATISSNVTLLLYYGRKVYQQNDAGNWWYWDDNVTSGNPWTATTDPRIVTPVMPNISTTRHPLDYLQIGNQAIATYWIEDNRWGQGPIVEGSGTGQFMEQAERALSVGPAGEIAARWIYRWPTSINGVLVEQISGLSEVKAYPAIIHGRKPGIASTSQWPAFEKAVRLPDGAVVTAAPAGTPSNIAADWVASGGSVSTVAPSGATPGTNLPRQLPISAGSMIVTGFYSVSATGKCHLSFDIWLQDPAHPEQVAGFQASPLTHEIMIPLRNFGAYGQYPSGRNPNWYSHDVTIDNVTYHVYAAKDSYDDGTGNTNGVRYCWPPHAIGESYLTGGYTNEETGQARIGWKFIVFQHDGTTHPLQPDGSFRIDLGKIINHLHTVTDSRGVAYTQGTERLVSVELGTEMVYGSGDWTLWNYKIVV